MSKVIDVIRKILTARELVDPVLVYCMRAIANLAKDFCLRVPGLAISLSRKTFLTE